MWKGRIAAFLLACAAITLLAQQEEMHNPYTSAADEAAGAKIFRTYCARCHGFDGTGDRGPALTRGEFRYGNSDAALFRTISFGIPARNMPDLELPENRTWQLVAFVRSLSRRPTGNLPGDPAKGEQLYRGKGNCAQCHMLNGVGGRLGPDLGDIGWLRTPQYLRTSIIKPHEEVDQRYWSVHIVHKDSKVIDGIRLNEDTYSIQVMDLQENLHSLWKHDLEEIREEKRSWMPNLEGVFSDTEIDHLVAYLYSLRRKETSQ